MADGAVANGTATQAGGPYRYLLQANYTGAASPASAANSAVQLCLQGCSLLQQKPWTATLIWCAWSVNQKFPPLGQPGILLVVLTPKRVVFSFLFFHPQPKAYVVMVPAIKRSWILLGLLMLACRHGGV